MLPFVVSGVYVVGGGLTAGSMMVLLLFCRLRVGLVLPRFDGHLVKSG